MNRLNFKDFRTITDHPREIYGINLKLVKKNQKFRTCNRLDLETLRFRKIMPKNLPDTEQNE